jgi:hypothetical protein
MAWLSLLSSNSSAKRRECQLAQLLADADDGDVSKED